VARKLDAEREEIRYEALKKFAEGHRLKDLVKDKVINDLKASLENMRYAGVAFRATSAARSRSSRPWNSMESPPNNCRTGRIPMCCRQMISNCATGVFKISKPLEFLV
jgi:hypothetical protein